MSKATDVIQAAIKNAQSLGLKVRPGAMFERSEDGTPIACDVTGAVALHHSIDARSFPKGWLAKVCDVLDESTWWHHRFCMGFDRGYQIMFDTSDNDRPKWVKDDVSAYGLQVRNSLR